LTAIVETDKSLVMNMLQARLVFSSGYIKALFIH
jgi:hypothetical protein